MKVIIRILVSLLVLALFFVIFDYYIDGLLTYILWGVTTAAVVFVNQKMKR